MLRKFFHSELFLYKGGAVAAMLTGSLAFVILAAIAVEALPHIGDLGLWAFFDGSGWAPSQGHYDLTPMYLGMLFVTLLGVGIAAPAGIALGAFCVFYAPPSLARIIRLAVALLSGLPSVTFGLFGLSVLVPLILQVRAPGLSLLAGALVLALMVLPTVASLSEAALRQVDDAPIRGAYALGLSRHAAVFGVAIPSARSALVGAVLLAIGRALGEAMAMLMVMGNVSQVPRSLFDPARTLTMAIASEMDEATGTHRGALFVAALLLLVLIGLFSLLAPQGEQPDA